MEPVGAEEPAGPAGQQGPPGSQGPPDDPGIAVGGPGLSAGVGSLVTEVRALRDEVSQYNVTAVSARRIASWVAASLLVSILLGIAAIGGAYLLIDRNNSRQQANATAQARALCMDWKGRAEATLLTRSSEAVRSGVRTAADAYRLTHCDLLTGALGAVDPEAYKPAPPG